MWTFLYIYRFSEKYFIGLPRFLFYIVWFNLNTYKYFKVLILTSIKSKWIIVFRVVSIITPFKLKHKSSKQKNQFLFLYRLVFNIAAGNVILTLKVNELNISVDFKCVEFAAILIELINLISWWCNLNSICLLWIIWYKSTLYEI